MKAGVEPRSASRLDPLRMQVHWFSLAVQTDSSIPRRYVGIPTWKVAMSSELVRERDSSYGARTILGDDDDDRAVIRYFHMVVTHSVIVIGREATDRDIRSEYEQFTNGAAALPLFFRR